MNNDGRKLKVVVRERTSLFFEGECMAVSSTNDIGPFDILVDHANFISIIKEKLTLHFSESSQKDFDVIGGVIRAKENMVEVYLGI